MWTKYKIGRLSGFIFYLGLAVTVPELTMAADEGEIILEIEGTILKCDKEQLISNSDYFKALLEGNFIEHNQSKIELKDVSLTSLEYILSWLNGTTNIPDEDVLDVLVAANYLQFEKITQALSKRLLSSLSASNSVQIWTRTQPLNIKPLYQEAKFLALKEFLSLKGNAILNLTNKEIYDYLSDVQLRTDSEYTVFKAAMEWWQKNGNSGLEISGSLKQLLYCISFSEIKQHELEEIIENPNIVENDEVLKILQCLSKIRLNHAIDGYSEMIENAARELNHSKKRLKAHYPWFFGKVDNRYLLVYYDTLQKRFQKFCELDIPIRTNKFMINVEGYNNRYVCILVKQEDSDMWDLWIYDIFLKKTENMGTLPYSGEYFRSTIVGDEIFILETKSVDKVIIYDMDKKTFREVKVPLHTEKDLHSIERNIAALIYNDKYLILSTKNKWAYFFEDDGWRRVNVDIRDFDRLFAYFPYREKIYLADKQLVELAFKNGTFVTMSETDLKRGDISFSIDAAVSGNKAYTLYTFDINHMALDVFDIEKQSLDYIIKDKQWFDKDLLIDETLYEIGTLYFIFKLDDNKFIDSNDTFVNEIPQQT